MVDTLKNRVVLFVLALLMAVTGLMSTAAPAEAYYSRLCSGYGSIYHVHRDRNPDTWHYTYSYRSSGSAYMEYWAWSSPTGWVYRGWNWC